MESVEFDPISGCDILAFGALDARQKQRRCWEFAAGMLKNVSKAPLQIVLSFIADLGRLAIQTDSRAMRGKWGSVTPDQLLTPIVALARAGAPHDRGRALSLCRIVVKTGLRDVSLLTRADIGRVRALVRPRGHRSRHTGGGHPASQTPRVGANAADDRNPEHAVGGRYGRGPDPSAE